MKTEDKIPTWLELMPDDIAGGPRRRAKAAEETRRMKAVAIDVVGVPICSPVETSSSPGYKTGGPVHSAKLKQMVEAIKKTGKSESAAFAIATSKLGYEQSILPGHRRKTSFGDGGQVGDQIGEYTGDSGDSINADQVNSIKNFKDHKGEFYLTAPVVSMLGGPNKVKQIYQKEANLAIEKAKNNGTDRGSQLKPIVGGAEAIAPVSEQAKKIPGYAIGGSVQDAFGESGGAGGATPGATDQNKIDAANKDMADQTAFNDTIAARNKDMESQSLKINPQTPISSIDTGKTTEQIDASNKDMADQTAMNEVIAKQNKDMAEQTALNDTIEARNTAANNDQLIQSLDSPEKQKYAEQLIASGKTPQQAYDIALNYVSGNENGTTAGINQSTAQINQSMGAIQDLAQGKGALVESIINQTMQKFGADTVGANAELGMRLAAAGISGTQAQAIQDSFSRNARIGAQGLQGNLAQTILQQAASANQALLSAATGERAFQTQQQQYETQQQQYRDQVALEQQRYDETKKYSKNSAAMETALATGDFATYAKLAKDTLGIDVDTTMLQDSQAADYLSQGMANLAKLNSTYKSNLTLDTPGAMDAVSLLWKSTAAGKRGETMPTDWAQKQLDDIKVSTSPVNDILNGFSEQEATDLFFDGNANAMNNFKFGTYKPGYESFQHGFLNLVRTGGLTFNTDTNPPTFDIDPDKQQLVSDFFSTDHGQEETAGTTGTTEETGSIDTGYDKTKTYSTSDTLSLEGKTYTVSSVNPTTGKPIFAKDDQGKTVELSISSTGKITTKEPEKVLKGATITNYDDGGTTVEGDITVYSPAGTGNYVVKDENGKFYSMDENRKISSITDPSVFNKVLENISGGTTGERGKQFITEFAKQNKSVDPTGSFFEKLMNAGPVSNDVAIEFAKAGDRKAIIKLSGGTTESTMKAAINKKSGDTSSVQAGKYILIDGRLAQSDGIDYKYDDSGDNHRDWTFKYHFVDTGAAGPDMTWTWYF